MHTTADTPICTCPSGDGSLRWPCPRHIADCYKSPTAAAPLTAFLADIKDPIGSSLSQAFEQEFSAP